MKKLPSQYHLRILCFFTLFFILLIYSYQILGQKLNISLSKNDLNFNTSDSIIYKFYLPYPVMTTIKLINIYGGEEIIYEENKPRNKGWHEFSIYSDSLKSENADLSSGVYYLDFKAENENTQTLTFNSFKGPWGELITTENINLDVNSGCITYHLPSTCFVKVRVGFENGSLVRSIIHLEPRKVGENSEFWDGWDQTKSIQINPNLNPSAKVIAFALPKTAFYLQNKVYPLDLNSGDHYPPNWNIYALNPYAKTSWKQNIDVGLEFNVNANSDTTLTFEFNSQSQKFNSVYSPENEIYISISNQYMVENPNVAVPSTYNIAFPELPSGKQTVLVNIILPDNRIAIGTKEVLIIK